MKHIILIISLAVLMAVPGMAQESSPEMKSIYKELDAVGAKTSPPKILNPDGTIQPSASPKPPPKILHPDPQPKMLYGNATTTEAGTGTYEVGVKFSKWSDATALLRPSRWKAALDTGGVVSWLNPHAWGEAPGRTAMVLLGEAVVVGSVAAGVGGGGGGGGGGGSDDNPGDPPGGGGGDPPPPPPGP